MSNYNNENNTTNGNGMKLKKPRPAFLTDRTILADTLSTIPLTEAQRLAGIVVSALVVHFGTTESLPTWPDCLETHISKFLQCMQMPSTYVASALSLLARVSEKNPGLYAEGDDAEMLFICAMWHVGERMKAIYAAEPLEDHPGDEEMSKEEYAYYHGGAHMSGTEPAGRGLERKDKCYIHDFEYLDYRYRLEGWQQNLEKAFDLFKDPVLKDAYWFSDRLGLDTFFEERSPTAREVDREHYVQVIRAKGKGREENNLGSLMLREREEERCGRELARICYFDEVMRAMHKKTGILRDDNRMRTAGPMQFVPAFIQCRPALCAFERGNKFPLHDDHPSGLPIVSSKRYKGFAIGHGDFKHVTHRDMEKWTQALSSEACETFDQDRDFYRIVVRGPYSKCTMVYSKDKRVIKRDRNGKIVDESILKMDPALNEEEREMWEDNWKKWWAQRVYNQLKQVWDQGVLGRILGGGETVRMARWKEARRQFYEKERRSNEAAGRA